MSALPSAAQQRQAHVPGFHEGERLVQERAGVASDAARLEGMLAPGVLSGGAAMFLAAQSFAVLVGRDHAGDLWASPLLGRPGFLNGLGQTLSVETALEPGDPLRSLPAGQPVALIALDLARRRRFRVNGWLTQVSPSQLVIEVEEAYGNCPSYIQQRSVEQRWSEPGVTAQRALEEDGRLSDAAARIVRAADTFFLGTQHPRRGADASHKGGNTGFVRIGGTDLLWPDYAGNNMFNSLGNLEADPAAGLLFLDFAEGRVLQLSGAAELEWRQADETAGDASTGRWVRFRPRGGVLRSSGVRADAAPLPSPHNPPVLPMSPAT
jgi:hypothetical protein